MAQDDDTTVPPPSDPPRRDRVGNDFHEGINPSPGGKVDTGDSAVPPYDDRQHSGEGHPGTSRAMGSETPLREPTNAGADEAPDESAAAPENVGESQTRGGENTVTKHGKEPGRDESEKDESTGRSSGTSTARDATGIDHDTSES